MAKKEEKQPKKAAAEKANDLQAAADLATSNFKKFCKENKLDIKTAPTDKALKKEWANLKAKHAEALAALESATGNTKPSKGEEKPKKPAKASTPRATKYDYPPEVNTPALKKEFRTKARAAAKAAAKAEGKSEKTEKTKKKSKKEVVPEVPVKKKTKKAKPSED